MIEIILIIDIIMLMKIIDIIILKFEKNLSILKEIKLKNSNLKDSIYQECLKNLFNNQIYERKDKSL